MKIDGGCHCGNITFEAEVDPDKVLVCHCTDCQSLSASAFRSAVMAAGDRFKISGKPKIYVKTGDSGTPRAQAFCPECGSQIYSSTVEDSPEIFNIRLGIVRQRDRLPPRSQIWCRSALDWVMDLGKIKRFEKQP